jgi:hypothetical protein
MTKVTPQDDADSNASSKNSSFRLDGLTGRDGEYDCFGGIFY